MRALLDFLLAQREDDWVVQITRGEPCCWVAQVLLLYSRRALLCSRLLLPPGRDDTRGCSVERTLALCSCSECRSDCLGSAAIFHGPIIPHPPAPPCRADGGRQRPAPGPRGPRPAGAQPGTAAVAAHGGAAALGGAWRAGCRQRVEPQRCRLLGSPAVGSPPVAASVVWSGHGMSQARWADKQHYTHRELACARVDSTLSIALCPAGADGCWRGCRGPEAQSRCSQGVHCQLWLMKPTAACGTCPGIVCTNPCAAWAGSCWCACKQRPAVPRLSQWATAPPPAALLAAAAPASAPGAHAANALRGAALVSCGRECWAGPGCRGRDGVLALSGGKL